MSLLKLEKYVIQEPENYQSYVGQKGLFKISFVNKAGINARLISLVEQKMTSRNLTPFFCFIDFKRSSDFKTGDYLLGTISSCTLDNNADTTYTENNFTLNFENEGLYLKKCENLNCIAYVSKLNRNSLECLYCKRDYKIQTNDCYAKEMYLS